jgi:hypothetical protein
LHDFFLEIAPDLSGVPKNDKTFTIARPTPDTDFAATRYDLTRLARNARDLSRSYVEPTLRISFEQSSDCG